MQLGSAAARVTGSLAAVESLLLQFWSEILVRPADALSVRDNFFVSGAGSMHIVQLLERVNAHFFAAQPELELPITDFFEHTTLAALAAHLLSRARAVSPRPTAEVVAPAAQGFIAVVGMAGRFPGAASVGAFWENLCNGVESIRTFTDAELLENGTSPRFLAQPECVKRGGLIENVELFDAGYFGMTPREAAATCPQLRLLLECAEEALQDAGYSMRESRERVGVFVATGASVYPREFPTASHDIAASSSPATRISYLLDLTGPSLSLDTACSSSLVAVHLACRALLNGECELALAGGASVRHFEPYAYRFEPGSMLSPDGHCRPFDRAANGTVFTSGAGIVLLKRLEQAQAHGDSVYAVIRGSAINNDGSAKAGYTAPSVSGQVRVIRSACASAQVEPGSIQYIETHGTGTALGDPIEIAALREALAPGGHSSASCTLGTLKANIGHLEVAAGIAGLMKAVLALHHQEIPPAVNFQSASEQVDLGRTPFQLNTSLIPWRRAGSPRRAGVSSFGIGGTNAHVVLEESSDPASRAEHRAAQLLPVSARSAVALRASCRRLAACLSDPHAPALADVAYTLQVGRKTHAYRQYCVCSTAAEAVGRLSQELDPAGPAQNGAPVVFMFPSKGSQHFPMMRELYDGEPVYRQTVDRCLALLPEWVAADLSTALHETSSAAAARAQALLQPALFVVEYALARVWLSWGIEPEALLGFGAGEYVAACLAGVFSLEDALLLVSERGHVLQSDPPDGGSVTRFRQLLETVCRGPVHIPYISGVLGDPVTDDRVASADYWVRQLEQVAELGACLESCVKAGHRIFLEVGPGIALSAALRQLGAPGVHAVISTGRDLRGTGSDEVALLQAVGALWQTGAPLDWKAFNARVAGHRVSLPTYPFDRQRHWMESGHSAAPARGNRAGERLELRRWFHVPTWKRLPALATPERQSPLGASSSRRSCCVLLEDSYGLSDELAVALGRHYGRVVRIRAGTRSSLTGGHYVLDPLDGEGYSSVLREIATGECDLDAIVHAWNVTPQEVLVRQQAAAGNTPLCVYTLLRLCRALTEEVRHPPRALIVLTHEAHIVIGGEHPDPEMSVLASLGGVISHEFPQMCCRTVDFSMPKDARERARLVDSIALETCDPAPYLTVAYRAGFRWARSLEPLAPSWTVPSLLRQQGVYLISGGLGAMGFAFAEHLAEAVRAKLILLGRAPFPQRAQWEERLADPAADEAVRRRIRAIWAMERKGAQVLVVQADVTDRRQVQQAIETGWRQFGAINGIIHAAGVAGGGVIQSATDDRVARVLAPKIAGTRVLAEAVAQFAPDFFVCCSSLAAIVSPPGQYEYCAANAFQDALAQAYDGRGRTRFISINWDAWADGGMAVAAGRDAAQGIRAHEGMQVLDAILKNPLPQWLISTRECANVLERYDCALGERRAPPYVDPETALRRIWQELLGIEAIGVCDNFFELGGDSLRAIELNARVQSLVGASITLKTLLAHPTIRELAAEIALRNPPGR